ncbi:unnamed protein product [Lepeophtheirus salmonis]|uniref:(salmon louse) hypothetical protein n=1 Tax=Lepeophtheirus salmonis TaxID=72036 RepID=A0A7R8H611_LEPSM|nr:unnamed protein product [Lepeophtheirus salmonis]CAF2873279.1 unnamed protein product [Lepeophtheirus salmonis]
MFVWPGPWICVSLGRIVSPSPYIRNPSSQERMPCPEVSEPSLLPYSGKEISPLENPGPRSKHQPNEQLVALLGLYGCSNCNSDEDSGHCNCPGIVSDRGDVLSHEVSECGLRLNIKTAPSHSPRTRPAGALRVPPLQLEQGCLSSSPQC